MPHFLEEGTRRNLAAALPRAAKKILRDYKSFMKSTPKEQASKDFAAKVNAGKVALAHLELLLKLAKMVDDGTANKESLALSFTALLDEAKADILELEHGSEGAE